MEPLLDTSWIKDFKWWLHNLSQKLWASMGRESVHCTLSAKIQKPLKVKSQIKLIVRAQYSSPPIHGARLAGLILDNPEMRQQWLAELVTVTNRITAMRILLKETLMKVGAQSSTGNWEHITN